MELITPDFGLLFWMTLAFGIVFFILAKFAFPVINEMLKKREEEIETALENAEMHRQEIKNMQADKNKIIAEAKEEKDKIISDGRRIHDNMIEEAKTKAEEENRRIIDQAMEVIEHERMAATTDIKNQIADISIKVAEKVLMKKLESDQEQLDYINRLLEEIENRNQIS
ncbi:MAG: F0F1 ATP synthase subunit B [Bacteroidales bacterium]|nr:F0F1 ATP synthase subunit B [Bacteroidales bacterium]MBR5782176.1 F0F1 ATP synthase subunit B [Bacteroidales bacterium]